MNYYKTNAVYIELEKLNDSQFIWVSGNAWILLYADSSAIVRVLAFVTGASTLKAEDLTLKRHSRARQTASMLAEAAGLKFTSIEFDDNAESIVNVKQDGNLRSLGELKKWFSAAGLPVSGAATTKAINKASSSAYHYWQRANLGAIKVSDLDLLRVDNSSGKVVDLYELKRSFISFSIWKPYTQDFPNFNVVANLAERIGSRFTIVYNIKEKGPTFRDDASRVSLFAYSRASGAHALGAVTFDDFVKGLLHETPLQNQPHRNFAAARPRKS